MKRYKKIWLFVFTIIDLLFIFFIWNKHEYSIVKAEGFQVNSTGYNHKLIIVTQVSEFKNAATIN